ncbi:hypothetical protein JANAI62_27460 [Jannaschia pagri]|uniref:Protease inhibitor Inh n=1 Tax=Jannaschia pagri TaxID=2829797 RepID=A0ABQ4NP14_9RHOB|nr:MULTISPECIES: hypothetical protein [unclassified Jannaschia]GIT96123.1 hypothetical protein JANAI62_27460 [Jannaschia sp. AI_62]
MRPALFLALPALMAGCVVVDETSSAGPEGVPSGETRVLSAVATPSRVTIRMSDGARCVAARPEGVPGGWSGVTADCGYQLPYAVTFVQGGSPARFVIEDPTGVPAGPDGRPGPRAEVIVTDVSGQRRLFISPLGPNVRFETTPAG